MHTHTEMLPIYLAMLRGIMLCHIDLEPVLVYSVITPTHTHTLQRFREKKNHNESRNRRRRQGKESREQSRNFANPKAEGMEFY